MCAPINLPSINGWCKNGINFRQFLGKYVRHQRHKLSLNLISLKKRVWLNDHIFSFFCTVWHNGRFFTYASFLSVSSHCVFKYKYIYLLFITKEHRETEIPMCPFVYLNVSVRLCVRVGDVNSSVLLIATIDVLCICFAHNLSYKSTEQLWE